MEIGRSFDDMNEKERQLDLEFNKLLSQIAKKALYNGIDIGMFCSLAFKNAEMSFLREKITYRIQMENKNV